MQYEEIEEVTVATLEENNPSITAVAVQVYARMDRERLVAWVQAVLHNPHISTIRVTICSIPASIQTFNPLLHLLATRTCLLRVELRDAVGYRYDRLRTARMAPFFQAIQRNNRIRLVSLRSLNIGVSTTDDSSNSAIAALFDLLSSAPGLEFHGCKIMNLFDGERRIEEAIRRNTTIQKLVLDSVNHDRFVTPILKGLACTESLKSLTLADERMVLAQPSVTAFQNLLASAATIDEIRIVGPMNGQRGFDPMAQALIVSDCITSLYFEGGFLRDRASVSAFLRVLREKNNLTTLTMRAFGFGYGDTMKTVWDELAATLRRPESNLNNLEIHGYTPCFRRQLGTLLGVVAQGTHTRLTRFSTCVSDTTFPILNRFLTALLVKELELDLSFGPTDRTRNVGRWMQGEFLASLKGNHRIQSLSVTVVDQADFFNDADNLFMGGCVNRNVRLAQWIENPSVLPQHLWPPALHMAQNVDPGSLYKSLLVVLPTMFGNDPDD